MTTLIIVFFERTVKNHIPGINIVCVLFTWKCTIKLERLERTVKMTLIVTQGFEYHPPAGDQFPFRRPLTNQPLENYRNGAKRDSWVPLVSVDRAALEPVKSTRPGKGLVLVGAKRLELPTSSM